MTEAIKTYYKQDEHLFGHCGGRKINYGKTAYGVQRKYCKTCKKASLLEYRNKAWEEYINPAKHKNYFS